ncbi:MAG: amino acid adenylation domain-containing protein [Oscillospiraceae bacterium]
MITNILQYLEQSAQNYPNKTAFAEADTSVTFSELTQRAKAIGSYVSAHSAQCKPVAVFMDKSVDAITAFMGAVYGGCFYIMLDVSQPIERLNKQLEILDTDIIITDAKQLQNAKAMNFSGIIADISDIQNTAIDEKALFNISCNAVNINPLYAMFTSGSTGIPKCVVVSHRSTIDFIEYFTEIFGIDESDVIANQAPLDFDVSVKDIYSGLSTGASVQLIPRAYFSFPVKLMDFLCERKATTLIWAVSALCFVSTMKGLSYKVPSDVKRIMFSGEVMPVKHLNIWRQYLPDAMYVNLYGPTEITCNCTYHILEKEYEEGEIIPAGIPFPNEKIILLDENNCLVNGCYIKGEICVSGTALALGYYGDIERTAQCFMQNPLNDKYIEIIYRTGDIGYYNEDGLLVYSTRKDNQIKHLGHRIELGEIETAMDRVNGIVRSVCTFWDDKKRLIAFYAGDADSKAIINALKESLPAFMMPNAFVQKETLPMTKNGKIDRKALLAEYIALKETKNGR